MNMQQTKNLFLLEERLKQGLDKDREIKFIKGKEATTFGFEMEQNGEIIAGISGKIRWGWMSIKYLWVSPDFAKKGFGGALVRKAEEYAIEKQCMGMLVDTFSYQAPEFYQKMGFSVFGEIQHCPFEHSRLYFKKHLKT